MTVFVERVRGSLAARDEEYAKRLLARVPRSAAMAAIGAERLSHDAGRNPFLNSAAFARILSALPNSSKGVERGVDILNLLVWRFDYRSLIKQHDPWEVLGAMPRARASRELLLHSLDESQGPLPFLGSLRSERRALCDHIQSDDWAVLLATPLDESLLGKRGSRKPAGAWRGVLVARLNALMPVQVPSRNSTIAQLLKLAGDSTITHRHVASILHSRSRSKR